MNYYNEQDPKCAQWLRNLIDAGELPAGDVDTRDIQTISPHELTGYTQQHFFAGIGGWSLALKLAGWPADRPVRTGSCPCQPFSAAGKGLAEADQRHLWPFFRDLIAFGEPTVTFGEQVASKAGRVWLSRVRTDLERMGYGVGAADLCSAGVGSPNIRQRLYWMAYANLPIGNKRTRGGKQSVYHENNGTGGVEDANGERCNGIAVRVQSGGSFSSMSEAAGRGTACGLGDSNYTESTRQRRDGGQMVPAHEESNRCNASSPWARSELLPCTDGKARRIEPGSFPLAHGIPGRVGLLRGYGNAINPYVAAEFIQASLEALNLR